MVHAFLMMLALLAAPLPADPVDAVVQGTVILENYGLPGVQVSIASDSYSAQTITNVRGEYSFPDLPPGQYDVTFSMESLSTVRLSLPIYAGRNDIPPQALRVEYVPPDCSPDNPVTRFDRPSCTDYEMDTSLAESIAHGESSPIDLLRQRHDSTFTIRERYRIAGMLLGHVSDDSDYWKELEGPATDAVESAGSDEESMARFNSVCSTRGLDEESCLISLWSAFEVAKRDPRFHSQLLKALRSGDPARIGIAISGLAAQHDEESLDEIDHALENCGDDDIRRALALELAAFRSNNADLIAYKYISGEQRDGYDIDRAKQSDK